LDGALDSYLLWVFSQKTVQEALGCSPFDRNRIIGALAWARERIVGLTVEAKLKLVESQHQVRADRLRTKCWTLEEYPVSRLGVVLPWMGDLPVEEIVKSFAEVAVFVRQQAASGSASTSVRYICSLSRIHDLLQVIPIMVIEPGSEQRRPDVLKARGREDLPISPTDGYIEDGNHRALAQAVADPDRTAIQSYVGRTTLPARR
jgi:hypothetical protein